MKTLSSSTLILIMGSFNTMINSLNLKAATLSHQWTIMGTEMHKLHCMHTLKVTLVKPYLVDALMLSNRTGSNIMIILSQFCNVN